MARSNTVVDTPAKNPGSDVDYDVLVIGGGAAGLSAAVFLARYGLETLVAARGKSAIEQCAHLENYLGFPGGVAPQRFIELGRRQVEYEGGEVREELVENVDVEKPDFFRVSTDENEYVVDYVLGATAYDGDMFSSFENLETDEEYGMVDTDAGRTNIDGMYAAGWMTDETVHQAVVSAGHGARAALSLIRDDISERFFPEVGEQYVDWVVHEGRYGREDWDEHTREWFEDEIVTEEAEKKIDSETREEALEHLRSEFLDRQISSEECERREREAQKKLLETIDDELIVEHAQKIEESVLEVNN